MKFLAVFVILFAVTTAAYGDDTEAYLELMRQDVRAEKVSLITEAMQFTDEQGAIFWPIYREYDVELAKLDDATIVLIKDYAANFETMTDEKADEIIKQAFKLTEKENKLRERYYKKIKKQTDAVTAAKFVQLENIISRLLDLQITGQLPLIQKGGAAATADDTGGGW